MGKRINYFAELKRRNVYRVAVAYAVVSWGLMEVSDILIRVLGLPEWTHKLILLMLLIGVIPTLIAAWALELTPEGIKVTRDLNEVSPDEPPRKFRGLNVFIIGMLSLVIGILIVERVFFVDIGVRESDAPVAAEVERSVAVLPFADLTPDRDHEWFADGIAEEIINALARTPDILVASRTSAFRYKGSDKDILNIAQELGVANVLEGSIRTGGDTIRITAQLIRARDGFHLWSQTYDSDAEDVIAVQEDVAIRIASALQTTMDPEALEDMMRVGTRSVRAYQAYIRGLSLHARSLRTGDSQYFLDAYEQFELARSIDPGFSVAHRQAAGFWRTQLNPATRQTGLSNLAPDQMLRNFMERIDLAVDTAKNETERSGSRAQRATVQLRLRNAIRRFREYLAERPADIPAWTNFLQVAQIALDRDAIDEALAALKTSGERDRVAAGAYVASAYRFGDPNVAADYGLKSLQRWPNDDGIAYQTHRALLWASRVEEAAILLESIDPIASSRLMVQARQACAEGRRDDVLQLLERLRQSKRRILTEDWLVLKMLGHEDEARELLDVYAESEVPYQLAAWLVYPTFDPGPFPVLVQMLERENVDRPPPIAVPFACPAPT